MKKSISFYLIKRYLRFDKTQPFITISTILSFLGVCLGLAVLMVAMALMNGFSKEFERKLFTMNYPLTIYPIYSNHPATNSDLENLKSNFPDLLFSPYVQSQALVKRGQKFEGVVIFGVDFEQEKKMNRVINEALGNTTVLKDFEILAGNGIKKSLFLEEGDKITLIFTKVDTGGLSLIPKMKRFDYKKSFNSGLINYDKAYIFTPIEGLSKVLNYEKDVFDGIHVYSNDPTKDIESLHGKLPSHLEAVGWWQQNGEFFSALKLEKYALFIVLMLIILVASINVLSSLLMTVMNRRQEIALLLSLGTHPKDIKNSFFGLGMIIGVSGAVCGILLGSIALFVLGKFDIITLPEDVYGMTKLPLELAIQDFSLIVIGALVIVAVSSYYPAKKATEVNILNTLRNE